MKSRITTAVLSVALLCATTAGADVLTFEDVPGVEGGHIRTSIADGYAGFDWSQVHILNVTAQQQRSPGSYGNAAVSGDHVAINSYANDASLTLSRTDSKSFNFDGAWFSAGWRNDLKLTVTGLLDGVVVDTVETTLDADPIWLAAGFANIDTLTFSSIGGTPRGHIRGDGAHFAMDDFTYTVNIGPIPEPATFFLFGAGILGLAALRRRK